MTKKEVQKRVLKDGKPLALAKFEWDPRTKTFSSKQPWLVLDFSGISGITFNTSHDCIFWADYGCTFNTVSGCTFNTLDKCTFDTGSYCIFKTGSHCTFKTGYYCTFKACYACTFHTCFGCTFNTDSGCTFDTDFGCTFNTGSDCTFNAGYKCTFNTGPACIWIIKGEKYTFSPLFIQGSAWPVNVYKPGTLKIGCEEHTFDYWLKNAKEIAAKHGVPQKYAEYIGLIKVAYEWAKLKGWNK